MRELLNDMGPMYDTFTGGVPEKQAIVCVEWSPIFLQ
jgi:hypothetical protein